MSKFEAEVVGLKEFKKLANTLPEKVKRRVVLKSLRAAARNVRDEAKKELKSLIKHKSESTGRLAKAIKVKGKQNRKWKNFFKASVIVNKGESRGDKKGAFYWRFVEYGTKKQSPKGFFLKASKKVEPKAKALFATSLKATVDKEVAKLRAK